jgi:HipA-like protein
MGILSKYLLSLLPEGQEPVKSSTLAHFVVRLDGNSVGTLTYDSDEWVFEYTDEFKNRSDLNFITDFPDKERIYKSSVLWPFFAVRIPGLKQPKVAEILTEKKMTSVSQVDLLRIFGQNTVANPYQLVAID